MSKFLHDKDDAKAIAKPWVYSKNSRAKNAHNWHFLHQLITSFEAVFVCA